jgi:hypothetical protein
MTWYRLDSNGGDAYIALSGLEEKQITLIGGHGYATRQEASGHPPNGTAVSAEVSLWHLGNKILTLGGDPVGSVGTAVKGAASDLLGSVNIGNWLLRIGEVLLGIVLIAVGVAHVTRAVPAATTIAKVAGAGALL